jgi:hypothetical protein
MTRARILAALAPLVLAACANVATRDCSHIYTLGDAEVAPAIARGQTVTKPGPLPATVVPPSAPRAALEKDGSYAGGLVFCSVQDARSAAATLQAKGAMPPGRAWRVYEIAASWGTDVYEPRPGEYRLKRAVRMVKEAGE